MNSSKPVSVLVVEESQTLQTMYQRILGVGYYSVDTVASLKEAQERLQERPYGLILLDLSLPDGDGMNLLEEYGESYRNRIIVLTGHGSIQDTVEAMRKGVFDFIEKPADPSHLLVTLEKASDFYLFKSDHDHLKRTVLEKTAFNEIQARSEAMQLLLKKAEKLAITEHNLLITGETGTGKELLARAIHQASNRRKQRFIAVNCATIPETLAESELFGFKRGAFTGAASDYAGKFKMADGGILFLDEIGDLPLTVQAKLLRVLENKEITPLKELETLSINVRVLAATNRDLLREVKEGRFREDLYYRISTLSLHLPPLRERADDIVLLAEHFLHFANILGGTRVESIDNEAKKHLMAYHWPGNVRELKNLVMELTALAEEDVIHLADLPNRFHHQKSENNEVLESLQAEPDTPLSLKEVEMRHILSVLKRFGNNYKRSAEALGMARSSLYRKLDEYGLHNDKTD